MHDFEKVVLEDKANPLKKIDYEKKEIPIHNDLEEYVYICGRGVALLSASVDKAKISLEFLKHSKNIIIENSEYTQDEYIEYAIENFLIRSHSIYDRALIFVSYLHNLGIDPEHIHHNIIVTNSHVKESGISEILKKMRRVCTEYRLERNEIIHQGRFCEEEFNQLSAIHKLNHFSAQRDEKPFLDHDILKNLTDDFVESYIEDFEDHLERIEENITKLYSRSMFIFLNKRIKYANEI